MFNKYDAYKDSGVEALGEIPNDWEVLRFRDICDFGKGLNITKENLEDVGIPCVNYGEVHSKYGFEVNPEAHQLKCVSESYMKSSPKSLLRYGDFVFADTSEDIDGSGNFTYLNSHQMTFAGYHTVIVRPKNNINVRFLAYVFDSLSFRNQIRKAVKGVKVYSITKSILKDTTIWLPDVDCQHEISQFLDTKVGELNQAIAIKEQQIALLNERKQIVIQKAVTQGLNTNVPMKDSGVEWIGQIPQHWIVKKLKYVLKERSERSKDGLEPLLMMSQVHGLVVRSEYSEKTEVAATTVGNKLVYKNDLVFNKLKAHLGVFFSSVHDFAGCVSPDYAVYDCVNYIENTKFLELLFRNPLYIKQFILRSSGIVEGLIRLYTTELFDLKIGIPPKDEQMAILKHIEEQSFRFDEAVKNYSEQIEKLKEYKTTLINDAVTGKIKVA
ncbi:MULTISPECIES: restriction endonuclease subunit S [unclassified Acinetobacter]|uniref:restriction endonuclease subunit S n=1 Tax=unclassified Acinetobacter TaxID=196816 RepID=UPI0015D0D112|nr:MULTISPECIES: restriction endonuclease subunit S [unclassified Acinetobacter]